MPNALVPAAAGGLPIILPFSPPKIRGGKSAEPESPVDYLIRLTSVATEFATAAVGRMDEDGLVAAMRAMADCRAALRLFPALTAAEAAGKLRCARWSTERPDGVSSISTEDDALHAQALRELAGFAASVAA